MKTILTAIGLQALAAAVWAAGSVAFDQNDRVISLLGYPEEAPATMNTLLQADQQNQWGVVAYDQAADTYNVRASIYIGTNTDLGTFLQIGRKDHPRETVVVKGDVWVKHPKKSIQRSDGHYAIANRLTLGDAKDTNIQATLKIDCAKAGEYALLLGYRKGAAPEIPGPALHVYNSAITAATPDKDHMVSGGKQFPDGAYPQWYASDVRLINAKMSWFGSMYGIDSQSSIFEGSTFDHVAGVFSGWSQTAKKCVFKNCGQVIGSQSATMIQCIFADNQNNWSINQLSRGITLIDCQVGPQKKPASIRKSALTPEQAVQQRAPLYPACVEWISLPVQVTDAGGRPVAKAFVNISCQDDPAAVKNGFAMTDDKGLTSADPEQQAILIIRKKVQATDVQDRPRELTFAYTVVVSAEGLPDKQLTISPGQELTRPLVIALDKPGLLKKLKNVEKSLTKSGK